MLRIMNIFDPKLGGDARLVVKLLTLASVIVAAITASFPGLVAVSSVGAAIATLLGILTHETALGNKP